MNQVEQERYQQRTEYGATGRSEDVEQGAGVSEKTAVEKHREAMGADVEACEAGVAVSHGAPPPAVVMGPHPSPPPYPDVYPPVISGQHNTNIQVEVHTTPAKKSVLEAYILMIPLGIFGAHHFYLRRPVFGIIYLFTFGLFGAGFVVDLFRLAVLVDRANDEMIKPPRVIRRRYLDDAYVLWFPFGLLGFHHYYLRRPFWGLLYTLTFGLLGIGWLIDGCRMHWIVERANKLLETADVHQLKKGKLDTYAITVFPFTGLLGFQHYYLGRYSVALFYTLTLGNMGVGWIVDLFRVPCLVNDYNSKLVSYQQGIKRLDDAYMYLFPVGGFLGLHHFYLNRPGWGLLYLLTMGCLGVGYLIDLFRLPKLVAEHNQAIKEGHLLITQAGRVVATGNNQGTPNVRVTTGHIQGPGVIQGPGAAAAIQGPASNYVAGDGQTATGVNGYPHVYNNAGACYPYPGVTGEGSRAAPPPQQLDVTTIQDTPVIPPSYDQVMEGDQSHGEEKKRKH